MGKVYVAFGDSREAQKAREKVHLEHPDWHVVPLTAREYAQLAEPSVLHLASDYEGQVLVVVFHEGLNRNTLAHLVESTIVCFGDIKSFRPLRTPQDNSCEFLVEFFDSQAADNAVVALKGASVDVSPNYPYLYLERERNAEDFCANINKRGTPFKCCPTKPQKVGHMLSLQPYPLSTKSVLIMSCLLMREYCALRKPS